MIVGVPREIKDNENRIAIVPAGVEPAASRAGMVGNVAAVEAGSFQGAADLADRVQVQKLLRLLGAIEGQCRIDFHCLGFSISGNQRVSFRCRNCR